MKPGSDFAANIMANVPNMTMMYQVLMPVFGNTNFAITPATPGEISSGFPTIPYVSLEAQAYQQQVQPSQIMTGNTTGAQTVQGTYNITDSSGNVRMIMGYQQGGF